MKKAKADKPKWLPYPEPIRSETGCKVGWNTYADRALADQCAVAARHNAQIQEGLGFDFGYCMPGSIDQVNGEFRVCLP